MPHRSKEMKKLLISMLLFTGVASATEEVSDFKMCGIPVERALPARMSQIEYYGSAIVSLAEKEVAALDKKQGCAVKADRCNIANYFITLDGMILVQISSLENGISVRHLYRGDNMDLEVIERLDVVPSACEF
jgi:hypothetical protein